MANVREKALLQERYRVWKTWPGLYHVVKSIFVAPGNKKMNFIVVASYAIKRPDGSLIERDTAANYHLVEQNGELKIKTLEIYAVSIVPVAKTFRMCGG